jgi:hypothetical protein
MEKGGGGGCDLSNAKIQWPTNIWIEILSGQWGDAMQHAPKRLNSFVTLGERWGVWTFRELDVSNVFPTSSQYVHIMFSMCSPPSSQYVHIMFSMCSPPSSQYVHIMFLMCSPPSSQYVHIMFTMWFPPSPQYVHIKNTCSIFVMGKGKWVLL